MLQSTYERITSSKSIEKSVQRSYETSGTKETEQVPDVQAKDGQLCLHYTSCPMGSGQAGQGGISTKCCVTQGHSVGELSRAIETDSSLLTSESGVPSVWVGVPASKVPPTQDQLIDEHILRLCSFRNLLFYQYFSLNV